MKHYEYKHSHYLIQMIFPGIFTMLIGAYCTYQFVFIHHSFFYVFVALLCIYNLWNLFVSASNPSEVFYDDENLIFISLAKKHEYKLCDIRQFTMRAMAGNGKIYMTINHGGLMKGRYWVRTEEFNNGQELAQYFYELDAKINPDSLFTKARNQGNNRLKKVKNI